MEDKGTKPDLILTAKLPADLVDFCLESEQPTSQHLQNLKDDLTNNALEVLCSLDYIKRSTEAGFCAKYLTNSLFAFEFGNGDSDFKKRLIFQTC